MNKYLLDSIGGKFTSLEESEKALCVQYAGNLLGCPYDFATLLILNTRG